MYVLKNLIYLHNSSHKEQIYLKNYLYSETIIKHTLVKNEN